MLVARDLEVVLLQVLVDQEEVMVDEGDEVVVHCVIDFLMVLFTLVEAGVVVVVRVMEGTKEDVEVVRFT